MRCSASARAGLLAAALLLSLAAWLGTLAVERAPAAMPPDATGTRFSGERAAALLQTLVGDNVPHPLGSAANARLRERIIGELRARGLTPQLQSPVMVCSGDGVCGKPSNIVARIPGSASGDDRTVLLSAHYDSVAAGPGASDNGAGVAAVLEIASILQRLPSPRRSIILLIEDGEEAGLLGALAFVQHHPWAASVGAAVNLDARGTSGPSLMFETGSDNRWLMNLYAHALARPLTNSVYYAVYKQLPHDTDFTVYKAAGWQGYNFAFIGDVAHYHTPLDDIAHADIRSLQQQGEQALATLLALANEQSAPQASGESVYFDLFTATLVRFPRAWAQPASALLLVLVVLAGMRSLRLGLLRWRTLVWGAAGLLAMQLLAAAASAALMALMRALGALGSGGAENTIAYPWALQLTFAALALLAITLIGRGLQRRAGFWGLWYGGTLLYAVLALPLAHWLPGASYLALLPGLFMLLSLLPALRAAPPAYAPTDWIGATELAAPAVCALSFVLLLPIAAPLFTALGADGLPLLTQLLLYAGFGIVALLAPVRPALQRMLIAAAALCVVAGGVVSATLPRYSVQSPQRLNLRYQLDADAQQAQWVAQPVGTSLPAALLRTAALARSAPPPFSASAQLWQAAAPVLTLPAPQLTLLGVERAALPVPPRIEYRLQVASLRGAPLLTLRFPPEANVRSVRISDPLLQVTPQPLDHGWSQLQLIDVPAQGEQISVDAGAAAFDLVLLDQSVGLPAAGAALQAARPATAVPWQDGDVTVVSRRYRLPP